MKNWKLSALLNTPLGVVIVVGLLILGVEFLIMLVIVSMHNVILYDQVMEEIVAGIIDPILLTLIVSPALYFLVFRKIQEGEQRFRQINAAALNAIVIVNEQGRITDWNPAAQKMFQYRPEEAVGQQLHQLIAPPRFHTDALRGFAHFVETGEGAVVGKVTEIAALRKDGSEFPVDLSISAVKLKGCWNAIGVIHDITERKLAENALLEAKHELQEFFDLVPDMVCIVSASDGCFQQVNNAWETILGFTTDELIGKQFTDFIHPDDVAPTLAEVEKQLAGQLTHSFTNRYRSKDGSYKWLEWDATPATKNKLLYAAARDITERKRTEDALRNTEQQYRTMIESSNDMIWTLAADGRFTFINQQAADVTGRSIQDWLGKTFEPLVLEEDLPKVLEIHGKIMKGEKAHYEVRGKKADGGILTLSVNASPIFTDGKVSGTISFASDITERKLAEAQLAEHVEELRRWHDITMGREMRTIELKREVNELLGQAGQPPRYPSAEQSNAE